MTMNLNAQRWQQAILPLESTIEETIRNLDQVAIKIVLVVNSSGALVGTVSDGDIRRGLLRGLGMVNLIDEVMNRNAMVVTPQMSRELVRQLMVANKVQQVPVINENHQVIGLHLWDEIGAPVERDNLMVIMAGGMGKRLRPFTENCPKPLLPVAGKPMLEHIIERAHGEGFYRFALSIHYLGHMIEEYFGNGSRFGVQIDYLREQAPRGTAGALSLLDPTPSSPFIVTNGDVLTDIRYGELLDFHVSHSAAATMAVRAYEWQHPYGVVHTRGVEVVGFEEKPVSRSHINAGVYALEPSALNLLVHDQQCDMPTLFERLQGADRRTVAYPMHEPWLDVGRPMDLEKARATGGGQL
jgi:dTDP-glucose pyrophosphorylase